MRQKPPVGGSELFRSEKWDTAGTAIREKYRSWWWRWQNEKNRRSEPSPHIPGQVARTFKTIALGTFSFQITGEPWELRLARVRPVGRERDTWQPIEQG
jgi:hypothetical protein